MKEIELQELNNYLDIFDVEKKPAIAMASDGERTNGLTIGWLSIGRLWSKPMATVYINKQRYSKEIFDKAKTYSINFLKDEYKSLNGYFGRVSGKDEDKIKKSGLTIAEDIAPYFEENRLTILCTILGRSDFDLEHVDPDVYDWYKKDGVHTLYYGKIEKILINE
ncbi:MAG: flavin reductase [Erysipelotrichaceae bacterium]|nr:flavin reductase [Erysipelotrichaceae bacterium]